MQSHQARPNGPHCVGCSGFTLIELMLVVSLVGTLASVAIPTFKKEVYKARRAEAILALSGVYEAELSYFTEKGHYGDTFDEIGFELVGGQRVDERTIQSAYYTYTLTALSQNGMPAANFQAIATGDLDPGDGMLDILMIENDLTIVQ